MQNAPRTNKEQKNESRMDKIRKPQRFNVPTKKSTILSFKGQSTINNKGIQINKQNPFQSTTQTFGVSVCV